MLFRQLFFSLRQRRRNPSLFALCGLAALFAAILAAAGCSHPGTQPTAATAAQVAAQVVSETECVACHADVSSLCRGTNHARTLRVADRDHLGFLAPPAGPIAGTCYRIAADGPLFRFQSTLGKPSERPMDLALGSGKLGMTYVGFDDRDTLIELRMSWYPRRHSWYLTPGQESDADNNPGEHNNRETTRSCMGCHATTVPAERSRPEPQYFGVGCQACHGPASEHVAAAKAGRLNDLKIDRIGAWNATRINNLCGRCHRSADHVGTTGDEVTMTQRFQPYGLMQSPCFKNSNDTLSCITCHNPHQNVPADTRTFEQACLRCHGANTARQTAATPAPGPAHRTVCPVNPKTGCIGCHMPRRKVFPVSDIPIAMSDHLIWAYGKKRPR